MTNTTLKFIPSAMRSWLVLLTICLALVVILFSHRMLPLILPQAQADTRDYAPPISVNLAKIEKQQWAKTLTLNGEVRFAHKIDIRNELEGRVIELGQVNNGKITKGQLILRFDDSQERAELAALEAEIKLAELDLKRKEKLRAQGVVSDESLDTSLAQRNSKYFQAEAVRAVIRKKTLRAPFDGKLGLHNMIVGQYLESGSTIATIVSDNSPVWVDFRVPQTARPLALGEPIDIRLPGEIQLEMQASVVNRDIQVNTTSRFLSYRATIEQYPEFLESGTLVFVEAPQSSPQEVYKIPTIAIRHELIGAFIFSAETFDDADNTFTVKKRKVSILDADAEETIVAAELGSPLEIVTNGAFKLSDGAKIRPANAATHDVTEVH